MKKSWGLIVGFVALFLLFLSPMASHSSGTEPNLGMSAYFDGGDSTQLKVTNSTHINMSDGDFTISWWQFTDTDTVKYPRVLGFGDGPSSTDKFAISEEEDGKMYLWINGLNIFNMNIPANGSWNHLAVTRSANTFRWYLNGNEVVSYLYSATRCSDIGSPDGCKEGNASFDTSNDDFFIGSNNDTATGGFRGQLAGVQIQQSVRWSGNFTPPENFLNPDSGLAFSLFVDEAPIGNSKFQDKSENHLTVTNSGASWTDFILHAPEPSSSPTSTPPPPAPFVINQVLDGWGNELVVTNGSSSFNLSEVVEISVGIPFSYRDQNNSSVSKICFVKLHDGFQFSARDMGLHVQLFNFQTLIHNVLPNECAYAAGTEPPPEGTFSHYKAGMFGKFENQLQIYLWNQVITDITDIGAANATMTKGINNPPEIADANIVHVDTEETSTSYISPGDTLTFTVGNINRAALLKMSLDIADQRIDDTCDLTVSGEDDPPVRIFEIPSIDSLITRCEDDFPGKSLDFIRYQNIPLIFWYEDDSGNQGASWTFTLKGQVSALHPTSTYDAEGPYWSSGVFISKQVGTPDYDYSRIRSVSIGIPVSYEDSGTQVNTTCHIDLGGDFSNVGTRRIVVDLPSFQQLIYGILPSSSCFTPKDSDHPEGYNLPFYSPGLFGDETVTATIYLWTDDDISDFSVLDLVEEFIPIELLVPPDVISAELTRAGEVIPNSPKVKFLDHLDFTVLNLAHADRAVMWTQMPEYGGWCTYTLPMDVSLPVTSFDLPSKEDFLAECRLQNLGNWEFNDSNQRDIHFLYQDPFHNAGWEAFYIMGADAPLPEPSPDPTPAPPTPAPPTPAPPTPIVEQSPTPTPAPPTPAPPTPAPPTPAPPTPAPPTPAPPTPAPPTPTPPTRTPPTPTPPNVQVPKAQSCSSMGIWIFTKSGSLQICDSKKKIILDIPACAGKASTPTFPWVFKPQRFKPGFTLTSVGTGIYDAVFFFKGLAIAGVESVSSQPCSKGSVFIDKKYSKQVFDFALKYNPLIKVKAA